MCSSSDETSVVRKCLIIVYWLKLSIFNKKKILLPGSGLTVCFSFLDCAREGKQTGLAWRMQWGNTCAVRIFQHCCYRTWPAFETCTSGFNLSITHAALSSLRCCLTVVFGVLAWSHVMFSSDSHVTVNSFGFSNTKTHSLAMSLTGVTWLNSLKVFSLFYIVFLKFIPSLFLSYSVSPLVFVCNQ